MPNNNSDNKLQSKSQGPSQNKDNSQSNAQADNQQNNDNSQIAQPPLSSKAEQLSTKLDELIGNFEENLKSKSNRELSTISKQLSIIERAMLLEKIDNQLNSMKESVIRPGDVNSPAAIGASAASAIEIRQPEDASSDNKS